MDMLVKLYEVHDDFELYARLREKGITLKDTPQGVQIIRA
mgnify:CR=1 FL=1